MAATVQTPALAHAVARHDIWQVPDLPLTAVMVMSRKQSVAALFDLCQLTGRSAHAITIERCSAGAVPAAATWQLASSAPAPDRTDRAPARQDMPREKSSARRQTDTSMKAGD